MKIKKINLDTDDLHKPSFDLGFIAGVTLVLDLTIDDEIEKHELSVEIGKSLHKLTLSALRDIMEMTQKELDALMRKH